MQGMRSVRALGASAAWLFAVYAVLMLALVKGFSLGKDFAQTSATLNALFEGIGGKLQGAAVQISLLLSDASSSQLANGTVYQTILFIIFSLAIIWLFRQHQAGRPVTFRAALYRGMFPLVPFMLVLLIMGLQLVPLAAGAYLFSTVVSGGIAVGSLEQVLAFIGLVGLALWSLRMLLASVFALLIVTLPDMAPLEAIRTAKALVYKRRLLVARKLLFLPFAILVGSSLLIMPFLVFLPGLAVWVFFVLSSTWFVVVYAYLYTLYRELIR